MICYIICAMPPQGERFTQTEGDLVIAADEGFRYAEDYGLTPELAVGDFDSLGYEPEGIETVRHPIEKDDTDLMLAVKLGLARGYRHFVILGALGGRTDHAYAAYQTLAYLDERGAFGALYGESTAVTLMREGNITLLPAGDRLLSAFAFGGEAAGVTLEGVRYPLNKGRLTPTFPLGVSNEIVGASARITLEKGRLLLFWHTCPTDLLRTLHENN